MIEKVEEDWCTGRIARIVLVKGPNKSCKSTSIKKAAALFGLSPREETADIQIVSTIKKGRDKRLIGFTSQGDDANLIRENIRFLFPHALSVAVMACSKAKHEKLIEAFCNIVGAEIKIVENTPPDPSDEDYSNRQAQKIIKRMWE